MRDEVILTRLDFIKDELGDIKEHLRVLNGQVAKNTASRNQQAIINGILGAIGLLSLGSVMKILFGG